MTKRKKIISFILLTLVLTGGYVFYLAKKRTASATDSKPIVELASNILIKEFESNPALVSKKYMDKNIAVTGIIKEVDAENANVIIEAGESCYINCSFDSASFVQQMINLIPGKNASIKGIYFGHEGFEGSGDGMDLIPSEKNIKLKTCAVNEK